MGGKWAHLMASTPERREVEKTLRHAQPVLARMMAIDVVRGDPQRIDHYVPRLTD